MRGIAVRRIYATVLLAAVLVLAGCAAPKGSSTPSPPPAPAPAPAPPPPVEAPCLATGSGAAWSAPEPSASQVTARAFLKDEPHVASPVVAELSQFPVTIVVQFSGPVAPESFTLGAADPCGKMAGVDQTATWTSDRQAEILVRAVPGTAPGPYQVWFGDGRDRQGLAVGAPPFRFVGSEGRPVRVLSQPLNGEQPELLWESRTTLTVLNVSPDGRYLLLTRPVNFLMHPQFSVIPYLLDRQTGALRTFARGTIDGVRWDLAGRALWLTGWRRIGLDAADDTGDELLARLPGGREGMLAAAASPDGRWLAVLKMTDRAAGMYGVADFHLLDLQTGSVRTLPKAFGYVADQPAWMRVSWSPDSSALLLPAYDEQSVPRFFRLSPTDLAPAEFPVQVSEYSYLRWSPGGRYVEVGKAGIFSPEGKPVLADVHLWGGIWSEDDRFVYLPNSEPPRVLELATGKAQAWKGGFPLGLSGDGGRIFFTVSQ